jgi:hypothetical protein
MLYILHPKVQHFWQSQCLDNIAQYLSWFFDCPIYNEERPEIGVPICLGTHYTNYVPPNGIIFNTEQLDSDSKIIDKWYRKQLAAKPYLDYSPLNGGITVPVGFCPSWDKNFVHGVAKDIHVLHYGSMNFRRTYLIEYLARHGVRVMVVNQIFGQKLDDMISRAEYVLHSHFYPDGIYAAFRCDYAAHVSTVVAEEAPNTPDNILTFKYSEPEKILEHIQGKREKIIKPTSFEDQRLAIKAKIIEIAG